MKLQSKVLLIIGSIWAMVYLVMFIDSKFLLEKNYNQAEEKIANKDIHRAQKAIDNVIESLRMYTLSFSQWDDAYQFMNNKNKNFIASNFVQGTFTSSNINFFIYFDKNGKYFYGQAFDLIKNTDMPIPPNLLAVLERNKLLTATTSNASVNGIIKLDNQYIIMSTQPILTSDGKGPRAGTLFMGYFLTTETLQALTKTLDMNIKLIPLPLTQSDTAATTAFQQLQNHATYLLRHNNDKLFGFTLLNDVNHHPIGLLKLTLPRDIYSEGIFTLRHYLYIVALSSIVILIALWLLLKFLILNRILGVGEQVIDINATGQFNHRINISGKDEINQMVTSMNSMLELIELTQDQLKYRITRRTKELEKLSHLNRNLFSEMRQQKSIESKMREDEKVLRKMAYYDSLTSLPNRAFYNELLLKALANATNQHIQVAVLFIDVDKFKKINDTYGHDIGDKLLIEIANRLKKAIGDMDVAARIAGDEFILFINNLHSREEADFAIDKIFSILTIPVKVNNVIINPTYSMGISIYPNDGNNPEDLIHQADLAMYYAKKRDGNVFYYYSTIDAGSSLLSY